MVVGECQNLSRIVIDSSFGAYQINFQNLSVDNYTNFFFLVDKNLNEISGIDTQKTVFVTASEANKTLSAVEDVMIQLSSIGMTKNNELLVIGGGYLQDIGTLVASLYMRGVKWRYVPTTLAAMGDSCIGGKSSINAGSVKNLVGNFYPPQEVLIDTSFVSTLPQLELLSGISEIIKICFAKSFSTFSKCSDLVTEWDLGANKPLISDVIQLSLLSKKYFVEIDEFDTGARKLLNFGHSFGHALESATEYKIPHGVAVLIGMVAASQHKLSVASKESLELINCCLRFSSLISTQIAEEIRTLNYSFFSDAIAKDKKNTKSELVLILPMSQGLEIVAIPYSQNALESAVDAMKTGIEMVLNEIR
jgi:3-dehydroquinate synthase